jgi:hypothetical protein
VADTLALEKLYDDVVARWAAEVAVGGTPVPNLFGWREPHRKETRGNRVIWVPGGEDGELGELEPPKQPGRNPRSLGTLGELFYVDILAADSATDANAENERKQYRAVRLLFDAWWRAVYLAATVRVTIVSSRYLTDHNQRRYGAGIRAVCSIEAMLPDLTLEEMELEGATAIVDTEQLDNTETDTIPEP